MASVDESVDWSAMEDRVFKIHMLIEAIQPRLQQVIHPARATLKETVSKVISSSSSSSSSSLPEGRLAETMMKNGQRLGADSPYGQSLADYGEALGQLAEAKAEMTEEVAQEVIDPIHKLEKGDLKQVMQHVKNRDARQHELQQQQQRQQRKLQQQKVNAVIAEDDVRLAEEKYEEASELAKASVANFLETESDQILLLKRFVEAQLQLHGRSVKVLEKLDEDLQNRRRQVAEKPLKVHQPKKVFGKDDGFDDDDNDDDRKLRATGGIDKDDEEEIRRLRSDFSAAEKGFVDVPLQEGNIGGSGFCVALYDFVGENEEDLSFNSGDVMEILESIDENWLRGKKEGDAVVGLFPKAYVNEY